MRKKKVAHVGAKSAKEEIRFLRKKVDMLEKEYDGLHEIVVSTMHEMREFSSIISSKAHDLLKRERYEEGVVKNIYYTTGLLAARLGFADIELNPALLQRQVKEVAVIYQKFDKARYILNHLNDYRDSNIQFLGDSYIAIDAIKAFEMVPFVLMQNAVKYSPPGYPVNVYFNESSSNVLHVKISSYGPEVEGDEVSKIFDKGFRGRNVVGHDGSGLGLYLAKRLCDFHAADIRVDTGRALDYELGGVRYKKFEVEITFENFK